MDVPQFIYSPTKEMLVASNDFVNAQLPTLNTLMLKYL